MATNHRCRFSDVSRTLPERRRGLEVAGRVCEVSQLAVQLAEPHVQVSHRQRR